MLGNKLLEGEKVRLAAVRREDISLYGLWFADLELLSYLWVHNIFPQTDEDEAAWFDSVKRDRRVIFGIRTLADDALIGNIELMRFDWKSRSSLFGIAVGDRLNARMQPGCRLKGFGCLSCGCLAFKLPLLDELFLDGVGQCGGFR